VFEAYVKDRVRYWMGERMDRIVPIDGDMRGVQNTNEIFEMDTLED